MSKDSASMFWNYRVITDSEQYWIGEVYYDRGNKPEGYTGPIGDLLCYDRLEDLTTTIRLIGFALDRPTLRVKDTGEILGDDLSVKVGDNSGLS